MFTDSHCHLTYLKLDNLDFVCDCKSSPKQQFLEFAKSQKVTRMMAIMCQFDEYDDIKSWVDLSDDTLSIGMSIGLHPCQDKETLKALTAQKLLDFDNPFVWAFGETGLDYHWDDSKKAAQKHSFAAHIHAGQATKKPIVVHTRSAYHDTLDILRAEKCEHGIIHCFTEDYAFAKAALDMGLYISFSGIVSFNKSTELQDVAKKLPLDRILIETDSPYLAPIPKRGRDNLPAYVPYVAQALAKLHNKTADEIGLITSANFDHLLRQYH